MIYILQQHIALERNFVFAVGGSDQRLKQRLLHQHDVAAVKDFAPSLRAQAHAGNAAVLCHLVKHQNRADMRGHFTVHADNGHIGAALLVGVKQLFVVHIQHLVAVAHQHIVLVGLVQELNVAENGVNSVPHMVAELTENGGSRYSPSFLRLRSQGLPVPT